MSAKSWHFIPLIVALTSIGYFATDIYMPSLPAITSEFGVLDYDTQMTLSAYFLSFCFTPLIFGPYSDAAGRKPVILGGLCLAFISTLLCIIATNIYWLIAARFFQGIGCGAVVTSVRAMLPDRFRGAEMTRNTSVIALSIPIVLAIAPAIGGVLQENFSWQSVFIFLALYIAALILWVILKGEETLPEKKTFALAPHIYYELCRNKIFLSYGLMACLVFAGISGYIAVSPFLFQNVLGLSAEDFGFLSFIIGGSVFIGSLINMICANRVHTYFILLIGILLQVASGIMLLICEYFHMLNTMNLLIASTLFFASSSLIFPNSLSGAFHALSQHYGRASAIISSTQLLAGFAAVAILSFFPSNNAISLGICYIIVAILTAGCVWRLRT